MKDHVLRRFSALCAAFVMLFSSIPVPAVAEGAGSTAPVCGLEEHRHTEECRQEDVLTCGKEEHVHTDACYPAPEPEPAPETNEEPEPHAEEEPAAEPEQPSEPAAPEAPAQPAVPAAPETPAEPAVPAEPAQPEEPETPAEPAEPETPAQPEKPEEPETPEEPAEPTDPEEPGEPAEPAETEAPAEPDKPEASETPAAPSETETPEATAKPEKTKAPEPTPEEKEEPVHFESGYVLIKSKTTAYTDIYQTAEKGTFIGYATAWAVSAQKAADPEQDWLQVTFDTEDAKAAGSGLLTGYIQASSVNALTEEEAQQLAAELEADPAIRKTGTHPVPVVGFELKEEPAAELTVEEAADPIAEPAGAPAETPEEESEQGPAAEPDEDPAEEPAGEPEEGPADDPEGEQTGEPAEEPEETPEDGTGESGEETGENPEDGTEESGEEPEEGPEGEDEEPGEETEENPEEETEDENGEETEANPEEETEDEPEEPTEVTLSDDGTPYRVVLSFLSDAGIPEGTELVVTEADGESVAPDADSIAPRKNTKKSMKALSGSRNAKAAAEPRVSVPSLVSWNDGEEAPELILYRKTLDISLVADGEEIEPEEGAAVTVAVTLPGIEAGQDVEVVHMTKDGPVTLESTNDGGTVTFVTDSFSLFIFTSRARQIASMRTGLAETSFYGKTADRTISPGTAAPADVAEGLEVLETCTLPQDADLWTVLRMTGTPELAKAESLTLYAMDGNTLGGIVQENLMPYGNLRFNLGEMNSWALVKDTGYRHLTLTVNPEGTEEAQTITLDGMMPKGAEAAAEDVTDRYAGYVSPGACAETGGTTLAAYDISIFHGDGEYQPDADKPISVEIIDSRITTGQDIEIWHIRDDGTAEKTENFTAEDGRISFEATGFSVYVVIAHEGGEEIAEARVEFHFISPCFDDASTDGSTAYYGAAPYAFRNRHGDNQTTQILKDGESLEFIPDPVNSNDEYFYGWYIALPYAASGANSYGLNTQENRIYYTWPAGPDRLLFEEPISITESNGTVSWTLGGASGTGTADEDGNVHVLVAPIFETYHFVNFMQFVRNSGTGSTRLMTRKLTVLGGAQSVEVRISDIQATSTDAVRLVFKGWEYNAGTEENPDWIRLDTIDFTGKEITQPGKDGVYISVSGDIDLYPIFIEARWADFRVGPSGNGATYVPSRFLMAWEENGGNAGMTDTEAQSMFTQLDAPTRNGYIFDGWYAGVTDYNSNTGEFTTGERITENTITDGKVRIRSDRTITGTEDGSKAWEVKDGKLKFYNGLSRLILHAKWTPATSAITIVYWTENAEDNDYFSSAVKTVTTTEINNQLGTGYTSGSTITLADLQRYRIGGVGVLDPAYLDDVGAVPAGEQIFFDLKTAAEGEGDTHFDASREISGEGTTLFNVYYRRKVFTLVFHIGRDGYISTSGEQEGPNAGSWLQMFYNDTTATGYDSAEGVVPAGGRGASKKADATMTYDGVTYTNGYATNAANIKNSYVPGPDENVYTIRAKYGAYIGDRWPTPTNPAFTFTLTDQGKEMYTWSAYYDSRFTQLANDRRGSGQNWHPDINGVYSYMSAELCSNRAGTEIINANQVHHFVAYFGDAKKPGVQKKYHILYEAVDGTYDPAAVTLVPGSDYMYYNRTTWAANVAQASPGVLADRSFYEVPGSPQTVISNLPPESQLASEIEGYEMIYSCYNTPGSNDHHIYFFYTPRQYTITFNYENEADRQVDRYYYTQSLAEADKYDPPEKTGYTFTGWYTNSAGAGRSFDFENETMPAMNLVLYPVMRVLEYRVEIDPNGGVIDHILHSAEATYFNANYGTPIAPYTITRDYVQLNANELAPGHQQYYEGTRYYYINTQFNAATDGDWGLPADLRNAVYKTPAELAEYYQYYTQVIDANSGYYTGITRLSEEEFYATYTSYNPQNPDTGAYRPLHEGSEHYTFMGWYQVYDNGTEAPMPYNFNDPVQDNIKLRAKWRLDGSIYVKYNPYYLVVQENGGTPTIVTIIGETEQWTDPQNISDQLYADQSPTHILRAPTNIQASDGNDWVFRGWRVVRPGQTSISYTYNGSEYTYQTWEPIQLDGNGRPVYYSPGDNFTIDSTLVSETDAYGGIIHMEAYYELEEDSYRHPDVTNLILDANDEYGGYVNTTDSGALPSLSGPGKQSVNVTDNLDPENRPTQILIGDLQSNLALHLFRYATTHVHDGQNGTRFFDHSDGYFLLGFDENSNPDSPTTGSPYVPAFAADSVAAVTRDENLTLYAMWEPMVYVTFINTTGADLDICLTGSGTDTISIVNEVTGEFDRRETTNTITVPAKTGDTNGRVKVVLPGAKPGTDSVTATAMNRHLNYKLSVGGAAGTTDPYGTGSENIRYGNLSGYTGVLITDSTGIVVTYTEEEEPAVVFDVQGGTWQETNEAFVQTPMDPELYTILQPSVETLGRYEPADPIRAEKIFLGWTTNADIAAHTDFSSTETVTWGDTQIDPDEDSIVLEKVRDEYLWDFSALAPYGQTLYAVWSDKVTVTFDVLYSSNPEANPRKYHTWNGPAAIEENVPYAFFRSSDTSRYRYITYTMAKGERAVKPQDPTAHTDKSGWSFLRWLSSEANDSCRYNAITPSNQDVVNYTFDFTQRVTQDTRLITSWIDSKCIRKYTYTVENRITGGAANEEFEYTITAASNMNYSGTYYMSNPSFLPVTTQLKNGETYTVEVVAVRYQSGWSHNSLYLNVKDRNGVTIASGHMIDYNGNYETSDYQVTLTVTQAPRAGYTTTVTSEAGEATTADLNARTYTFGTGRNTVAATNTVNTAEDSFTFRSSNGNNNTKKFVGEKKNADYGTDYPDIAETIIFTNIAEEPMYPAPTGLRFDLRPFGLILLAGLLLTGIAVPAFVRKHGREEAEPPENRRVHPPRKMLPRPREKLWAALESFRKRGGSG